MTPFFATPKGGIRFGKRLYGNPKLRVTDGNSPARSLFVTDLQLRPSHSEMARICFEAAKDAGPELICLGGDMAEYDEGLKTALEELRRVFPKQPVFAVPGNNDDLRYDGDRQAQTALYTAYDCRYLLNASWTVETANGKICVAGTEDGYSHEPSTKNLIARDCYSVLLTHAPHRVLLEEQSDLMLSGHTHGGQINVLGFTCYGMMRYEPRFDFALLAGTKRLGKTLAVVSRGIGWSKYPVRVGADPEIHLII